MFGGVGPRHEGELYNNLFNFSHTLGMQHLFILLLKNSSAFDTFYCSSFVKLL